MLTLVLLLICYNKGNSQPGNKAGRSFRKVAVDASHQETKALPAR